MSDWYVNSAWTDFFALDGGTVTRVDCSDIAPSPDIDARDALSEPEVETLLSAGLSLWPRGAAWGAPGDEAPGDGTVLAGLTRALLSPFADLYARAWRLTAESRASTIIESLEDWERDWGLPDPCTAGETDPERRLAYLRVKVAGLATVTPSDFVRLAARLGYVVAIEEPEAFRAGEGSCLDLGEPSDTGLDQQWVVHVHDVPVSQFEAGIGETGIDRLLDFDAGALECAVRRSAPGWTYPIFDYGAMPLGLALTTEDGTILVTETGLRLIAPVMP